MPEPEVIKLEGPIREVGLAILDDLGSRLERVRGAFLDGRFEIGDGVALVQMEESIESLQIGLGLLLKATEIEIIVATMKRERGE